ncbi:hypothetical protein GCM10011512_20570 [Tersicoccus solisilvae]|uniref:DUF4868 domain-containing protein n=1 Tax=Tersicoccus solisilvae TaxID=1882339 RepID=A0ABQ1P9S3_9MICC|nr:Kiwa anti-phage protein KwaB-like domain-containing protein [Tersicoccus solisilvae]GGC93404.1 hypothetical protein GCM10011512_20570 [Tersicoccus solisilvae]
MTSPTATDPAAGSGTAPELAGARDRLEAVLAAPTLNTVLVRGTLTEPMLSAVDFTAGLAADVVTDIGAYLLGLLDRELVAYDPSYRPGSHEALVDALANAPALAALHARVLTDDLPLDRGREEDPVVAMVHVLTGADGDRLAVYRLKGEGIATRRVRGVRALLPRDGYWEPVPEAHLLYYSPRFDAAVIGDHVLFTAVTTLAQQLQAPDRARTMARTTFATATASVAIDGADQLAEAVSTEPAMIAKMAQLARLLAADPAYADALTTPNLVEFIDRNPQFGVTTAGEGQHRRLVYESSPQTRFLIVKLLADDLLRSDLTDRRYEAGTKHRVAD